MTLGQSGLEGMRLGLAADALDGGDVGPVARAEKHGAGGDRPVDELLLCWIPGGHDDIAGSGVTIGAVVLCSLQPWEMENMLY